MRPALSLALLAALAASAAALEPGDLKPALTSQESKYYESIKADPNVAQNFLATREYVRKAKYVADHPDDSAAAARLPDKPAGFTVRYLLAGEANVINTAISLNILANSKGTAWA